MAKSSGPDVDHKKVVDRLNRLEGQVRGLRRMVEEGADCERILIQFSAIRGAFQAIGVSILARAMKECIERDGQGMSPEAVERSMKLFRKYAEHLR